MYRYKFDKQNPESVEGKLQNFEANERKKRKIYYLLDVKISVTKTFISHLIHILNLNLV